MMHSKAVTAIQPFREKKMVNINIMVARTFTRSGIVWAMKCSIFSMFCSISFFIAPVEVEFRKPRDNPPICEDTLTFNPYRMRKAAMCDNMDPAYINRRPTINPTNAHHPHLIMWSESIIDKSEE